MQIDHSVVESFGAGGRTYVHPDAGVPQEGRGRRRTPLRLQPRRGGHRSREPGRLGDEDPEDERAGAVARGPVGVLEPAILVGVVLALETDPSSNL